MRRLISIDGPAGALEGVADDPDTDAAAYAVLCHPHPLFGGTMDNKVVTTVAGALRESGIPTLRFNYRGVGASAGSFDEGIGETLDAAAVADWGAARWVGRQLIVAGFSFGAYVALRLAQKRSLARILTIAPPVERCDFSGLSVPDCPWLIVQGDADDVVDPQAVARWAQALFPPPKLLMLTGVGHFFHGHLQELRDAVSDEIRSV